jgi:hypothetical protein
MLAAKVPVLFRYGLAAGMAYCGLSGAAYASDASRELDRATNRCVSIYGPGFVAVEDSETCIKLGGRVRVELGSGRPAGPNGGWDLARENTPAERAAGFDPMPVGSRAGAIGPRDVMRVRTGPFGR